MQREEVRFQAGKEECAGWLFRPASSTLPSPCVVMASGLSCVREQRLDAFAESFAAAGYAVLAFDHRHFGTSGGSPRSLMSARRQRDDWRAALAYARGLEFVDGARIALWGFSLGGGNVQALAIEEPGIAAAICVAPLVDGLRTLLYIGGVGHIARLGVAGVRDALRALRAADPYLVRVAGPPGSRAVLAFPGALAEFEAVTPTGSSWRNDLCARAVLAPPYRLARKTKRIACPILYCIAEDDLCNPPALGVTAARGAPAGELRLYPGGHFAPLLAPAFESVVSDQVEFLDRCFASDSGRN
ncbi:MAG TPA: alpha/beta fold hydrolase [Solirubrobacterales bacterium]|jgi:dienelactone hydrolase|nr:alpha/beta fold hydrolase [Solirubrobacterales bacterium]